MCFITTCHFLTISGYKSVNELKIDDYILQDGNNSQKFQIKKIFKLPEYKVIKMIQIKKNAIEPDVPNRDTYLKPTQYLKIGSDIIKASDLVTKLGVAEYERYNILNFYLLTVDQQDIESKDINEFVNCNGLQVSVYNSKHPLNNRFIKYSVK